MLEYKSIKIFWLGHSSFRIEGSKTIYIDPFQLDKTTKPADYIFITHNHFDHCSPKDIERILAPHTIVFCSIDCLSTLSKVPQLKNTKPLAPNQQFRMGAVQVQTFPAYNTNKKFHPKENDWLSYVITLDDVAIYHTGDSDIIPEMANIACDIALLPVSGTYVMTADEAAKAAKMIKPKLVIPMHYGSIVGTQMDAHKLKAACSACEVKILDQDV